MNIKTNRIWTPCIRPNANDFRSVELSQRSIIHLAMANGVEVRRCWAPPSLVLICTKKPTNSDLTNCPCICYVFASTSHKQSTRVRVNFDRIECAVELTILLNFNITVLMTVRIENTIQKMLCTDLIFLLSSMHRRYYHINKNCIGDDANNQTVWNGIISISFAQSVD